MQGAVAGAGVGLVGRLVDDEELTDAATALAPVESAADPEAAEDIRAFVEQRAADFRTGS